MCRDLCSGMRNVRGLQAAQDKSMIVRNDLKFPRLIRCIRFHLCLRCSLSHSLSRRVHYWTAIVTSLCETTPPTVTITGTAGPGVMLCGTTAIRHRSANCIQAPHTLGRMNTFSFRVDLIRRVYRAVTVREHSILGDTRKTVAPQSVAHYFSDRSLTVTALFRAENGRAKTLGRCSAPAPVRVAAILARPSANRCRARRLT